MFSGLGGLISAESWVCVFLKKFSSSLLWGLLSAGDAWKGPGLRVVLDEEEKVGFCSPLFSSDFRALPLFCRLWFSSMGGGLIGLLSVCISRSTPSHFTLDRFRDLNVEEATIGFEAAWQLPLQLFLTSGKVLLRPLSIGALVISNSPFFIAASWTFGRAASTSA